MKFTGLILAPIGLIAGIVCVVMLMNPTDPNQTGPMVGGNQAQRPSMVIPIAACGLAIVIGGAMYLFGGRGYYYSRDPRVRN